MQGPIFGNIILADEINRTPPKTQSALLEAMQEKSCTVRGNHYKLPAPFFVLATQNPIELEGTYPLPEAQLDRFHLQYRSRLSRADDEMKVIGLTTTTSTARPDPVTTAEEILGFQQLVRMVPIARFCRAVRGRTCAHDAPDRSDRARFREEVRQLRRQRSRHSEYRSGGEGQSSRSPPLSRHVRRRGNPGRPDPAPSHSAQFPCRIGSLESRRHPETRSGCEAGAEGIIRMQQFLDPNVLASISGLELIAKTVVEGFVSGLHRSPHFGFSQEFAEYRAYSEGDDLRHVDWNVFARTESACT